MIVVEVGISAIIFCPIILFIVTYILLRNRMSSVARFGVAADLTTFILFFSVPLSISSLWGMQYSGIVFVVALFIAIIFTYIDWKSKKEIELLPLFKKIWRVLFILLSVTYFFVWLIGIVQHILLTITN